MDSNAVYGKINLLKPVFLYEIPAIGFVLIILSFLLHKYAEKSLNQAHDSAENIKKLVDTGAYAYIRHPIYTSLIIMEIGFVLSFSVFWVFILVLFSVYLHLLTCFYEEKILKDKFDRQYLNYMKKVPYRLIPYIF